MTLNNILRNRSKCVSATKQCFVCVPQTCMVYRWYKYIHEIEWATFHLLINSLYNTRFQLKTDIACQAEHREFIRKIIELAIQYTVSTYTMHAVLPSRLMFSSTKGSNTRLNQKIKLMYICVLQGNSCSRRIDLKYYTEKFLSKRLL